jgi:hypothetical protein
MDKPKRNSGKGKGKSKPYGRNRGAGNNRSSSRTARVGDRVVPSPKVERETNPVVELLTLLRAKPSTDGIKAIVDVVAEEHSEYFNLGKAVRNAMKRTLTDEEETLVKKLGANA